MLKHNKQLISDPALKIRTKDRDSSIIIMKDRIMLVDNLEGEAGDILIMPYSDTLKNGHELHEGDRLPILDAQYDDDNQETSYLIYENKEELIAYWIDSDEVNCIFNRQVLYKGKEIWKTVSSFIEEEDYI